MMKPAAMLILFLSLVGCVTSSDIADIRAFQPSIDKDGNQLFVFTAKNYLPSHYGNADVRQTHESWIAKEIGDRQYCHQGFEITNTHLTSDNSVIYEGRCK